MKKVILLTIFVISVTMLALTFASCSPKESTPTIKKFEMSLADDVEFKVGDTLDYNAFVFKVELSDGSIKTPTSTNAGIVYDLTELKLVDSAFTEAGEFTVRAVYLNEYKTEIKIVVEE
ncbi:MAG: hypothetical protein LBF12_03800 [Christensenellaceae bacterium]|jgi:uncharacterized protein YijF (DUF1287 family)|nr:hypothetical protein [Christensenellaceae bacterium]